MRYVLLSSSVPLRLSVADVDLIGHFSVDLICRACGDIGVVVPSGHVARTRVFVFGLVVNVFCELEVSSDNSTTTFHGAHCELMHTAR